MQLNAVLIAEDGGIVSLSILGFQRPLAILVGQAEALALVHSAGADLRRPSTLATWRHCLAVRCCPRPRSPIPHPRSPITKFASSNTVRFAGAATGMCATTSCSPPHYARHLATLPCMLPHAGPEQFYQPQAWPPVTKDSPYSECGRVANSTYG